MESCFEPQALAFLHSLMDISARAGIYLLEPRIDISLPLANMPTVPRTVVYARNQNLEMDLVDKTVYKSSDS